MLIGKKLQALRTQKNMFQGEIDVRTGLVRCYMSRVENGRTVPAIETLEKIGRALDSPLYRSFYDGDTEKAVFPQTVVRNLRRLSRREIRCSATWQ